LKGDVVVGLCEIYIPYILTYKSKNFGQIFALKVGVDLYGGQQKNFGCWTISSASSITADTSTCTRVPEGISLYTQPAVRHHLTSDEQSTPAGVKFHSLKCVTGISRRDNKHTAQLSSE